MAIQYLPSFWGNMGDAFQAMLQNAMMIFMLKKLYPEMFEPRTRLGQTPLPPARNFLLPSNPFPQPINPPYFPY